MQPVLNILVALNCEAKPIIDFYRLAKMNTSLYPHFYSSEDKQATFKINLVVSGIGLLNMAAACGWLGSKTAAAPTIWLNIGTAGHANLKVGEIVQVVACGDSLSSNIHYPPLVAKWEGASTMLNSYNQACMDYLNNTAVDMEASAFYFAAKKSASTEFIQSLKVISDNSQADIEALNASRISELIAPHVETIDAYAKELVTLLPNDIERASQFEMSHLHCTVAQQQQFKVLVEKLQNTEVAKEKVQHVLDKAKSMKEVLLYLREQQVQMQPNLVSLKNGDFE